MLLVAAIIGLLAWMKLRQPDDRAVGDAGGNQPGGTSVHISIGRAVATGEGVAPDAQLPNAPLKGSPGPQQRLAAGDVTATSNPAGVPGLDAAGSATPQGARERSSADSRPGPDGLGSTGGSAQAGGRVPADAPPARSARASPDGNADASGALPGGSQGADERAASSSIGGGRSATASAAAGGGARGGGQTAAVPPAAALAGLSPRARRLLEPSAPDRCPDATPRGPVMLVFDGSVSMGLPLDMDPSVEHDLDRRMARGDEAARSEYRRWLAAPGPKRLDEAKSAVASMLRDADSQMEIGAVAFTSCREVATVPLASPQERSRIGAFIDAVTPHRGGDTALADSVHAALGAMTQSSGRGRIIVLTDGEETCGGNVCALARSIAAEQPDIRVDVVDLSGESNAGCLAEATGGVAVTYAQARDFLPLGRLLLRAAQQCPMDKSRPGSP